MKRNNLPDVDFTLNLKGLKLQQLREKIQKVFEVGLNAFVQIDELSAENRLLKNEIKVLKGLLKVKGAYSDTKRKTKKSKAL